MKSKVFLIPGLILLVAGLTLCLTSMVMVDFNVSNLGYQGYTKHSTELVGSFRYIEIIEADTDIYIEYGDSTTEVEYYTSDFAIYYFAQSDGKLKITKESKPRTRIIPNAERPTLTVKLPADFAGSIDIKGVNCDIRVSKLDINKLEIENTRGEVDVSSSRIDNLKLNNTNGHTDIFGNVIGYLSADNSNGSFSMHNSDIEQKCEIKSSSGFFTLNNVTSKSTQLKLEALNCKIRLEDIGVNSLSLDARNSDVIIDKTDVNWLVIKNSNGSVSGMLSGRASDYRIEVSCTNGKSNLATSLKENYDRSIRLETVNGDIDVEFELDVKLQ